MLELRIAVLVVLAAATIAGFWFVRTRVWNPLRNRPSVRGLKWLRWACLAGGLTMVGAITVSTIRHSNGIYVDETTEPEVLLPSQPAGPSANETNVDGIPLTEGRFLLNYFIFDPDTLKPIAIKTLDIHWPEQKQVKEVLNKGEHQTCLLGEIKGLRWDKNPPHPGNPKDNSYNFIVMGDFYQSQKGGGGGGGGFPSTTPTSPGNQEWSRWGEQSAWQLSPKLTNEEMALYFVTPVATNDPLIKMPWSRYVQLHSRYFQRSSIARRYSYYSNESPGASAALCLGGGCLLLVIAAILLGTALIRKERRGLTMVNYFLVLSIVPLFAAGLERWTLQNDLRVLENTAMSPSDRRLAALRAHWTFFYRATVQQVVDQQINDGSNTPEFIRFLENVAGCGPHPKLYAQDDWPPGNAVDYLIRNHTSDADTKLSEWAAGNPHSRLWIAPERMLVQLRWHRNVIEAHEWERVRCEPPEAGDQRIQCLTAAFIVRDERRELSEDLCCLYRALPDGVQGIGLEARGTEVLLTFSLTGELSEKLGAPRGQTYTAVLNHENIVHFMGVDPIAGPHPGSVLYPLFVTPERTKITNAIDFFLDRAGVDRRAWRQRRLQPLVAKLDQYGDPLSEKALLRLGCSRLRQGESLTGLSFSPDGQVLVSDGASRPACFWEMPSGRALRFLPDLPSDLSFAAFSPDNRWLVAFKKYSDSKLHVLDAEQLKEHAVVECPPTNNLFDGVFSPDGKWFAASSLGSIFIVDIPDGVHAHLIPGPKNRVGDLAFAPDSATLYVPNVDGIDVLNISSGERVRHLDLKNYELWRLAMSRDGSCLALPTKAPKGLAESEVHILDAQTGVVREVVLLPDRCVNPVLCFSPDGSWLVVNNQAWNRNAGRYEKTFGDTIGDRLAFSPSGQYLAQGSSRGVLHVWEFASGQELMTRPGGKQWVVDLAFSADNLTLAAKGDGDAVQFWDLRTGQPLAESKEENNSSLAMHLNRDNPNHVVRLVGPCAACTTWPEARVALALNPEKTGWVYKVACNRNSNFCAVKSDLGITVWNLSTATELARFMGMKANCMALSPDGQWLAVVREDQSIDLIEVSSEKAIHTFAGGYQPYLAFSPDGQTLVAASKYNKVLAWKTQSGKEVFSIDVSDNMRPDGHQFSVALDALGLSPDGKLIALGSDMGAVLLDAVTGRVVAVLNGHRGDVCSVAFSPDGQRLATGGRDTTIVVWDVAKAIEATNGR